MPRAIWSGSIAFGLVNIPVRMYSAIDEKDVRFHYVHEKDDSPIGYQKICKQEDKPVPDDEIVKAYEEDGEYVYMTDEDFEAAEERGYRAIDVTDFVPFDEIDPIYFEKTYYLGPQEGAEKVYALFVKAMDASGLAGIAKYVMRAQQHLGCLRIRDGTITLEKMFFADEIRPLDGIAPKSVRVAKAELELASDLIDRFAGSFDPKRYEDTYRKRLLKIIRDKQKGKEVHVAQKPEAEEEPPDLMEALRASVEASRKRGGRRRKTAGAKRASGKKRTTSKKKAAA
jgi:DNA end-binding protein Ku